MAGNSNNGVREIIVPKSLLLAKNFSTMKVPDFLPRAETLSFSQ